ncbi:MAG TPA: DUF6178 family protein [Candidatus Binataceae bacterium]
MPVVRGQAEFLNLPFQEKLEFLYGLPARQKRDLILSAPEAERLVQSFSPETLFYTLKEIGSADAGDLLSLALPEQVKSLFDLDCWDKDRPNFDRMREWIDTMAESGRRRMADGLMELDLELMSLLLRRYIKVHRMDDPAASPDAPSNRFVQFEENYLIEFKRHDPILPLITDFLEEAFERDYRYFSGLMEEIYWGVEAELEEEAYQFRRARLNDRGFPDFYEAQDVFAYIDPRRFFEIRAQYVKPSRADLLNDEEIVPPDMAPVSAFAETSLFNAALTAGFAAQGKRQIRSEMAMVTNQVLVAMAIDFGDPDAVRVAVEMTHHYLNLGLEYLAGGDLQNAIEHLRNTDLKLLFRLGMSLTLDLRKRAEASVSKLGLAPRPREIPYLDSPYREALAGFLERRPRFYAGAENRAAVELRDFRTMNDLHLAYAILDEIDSIPHLFRAMLSLDITSPAFRVQVAGHEVRLSQILLTAFARYAIEKRLSYAPIEASLLPAVRGAVMSRNQEPARLSSSFHEVIDALIAERLAEETARRSAAYINSCLNLLEDEFSGLVAEPEIDPRYIGSLLLRLG